MPGRRATVGGTERGNSLAKIAKRAKKNSEILTFRTLAILAILARVISAAARNSRRFAISPGLAARSRFAARIGPLALVYENIPVPARHLPELVLRTTRGVHFLRAQRALRH